jgi:hypothetical protein
MCDRACEGEPEQREHNSDCDQTDLPRYVPSRARPSSQQLCLYNGGTTTITATWYVICASP